MAAKLPDNADIGKLEAVLTAMLDALAAEDLDQALQIVLLLGWRWSCPTCHAVCSIAT